MHNSQCIIHNYKTGNYQKKENETFTFSNIDMLGF